MDGKPEHSPLAQLSRDDMVNQKPSPTLAAKSVPAKPGQVAAFVSHSWSDDGDAKMTRLHEWAKASPSLVQKALPAHEPSSEPGAPPLIWLDKACIDQGNIDRSLACLPIFLSGCQELLMLAGRTWPSRLWCVMELFVFVQMGGQQDRINVQLLGDDAAQIARHLACFDAGAALCYLDSDRQKLWAVIEASFGTFAPFNNTVRAIFAEKLEERSALDA